MGNKGRQCKEGEKREAHSVGWEGGDGVRKMLDFWEKEAEEESGEVRERSKRRKWVTSEQDGDRGVLGLKRRRKGELGAREKRDL